ncbi:MAG: hypothetical protein J6B43_11110 [Lachnospiraceae bacterium]|nr:hypothetical protein [Lachnospiraceae bacterium]
MTEYKIGQVVESFIGHDECVKFDLSDAGGTLIVFFQDPAQKEIEQFRAGERFEIRMVDLQNVIMLTMKIGSLNWMDAPYTPHLSPELTRYQLPESGEGLALTVILVDTATGRIKHMRLLGLSSDFTKKLFGAAMEKKMQPFDKDAYFDSIQEIYAKYQTKDLVKMSTAYCKFSQ